jgi:hypothetical protein
MGHFPDGRERHRTFSVKNIKPDADDTALIAVVRAVGSLLAYPVTHARLIVKSVRVLFDNRSDMDAEEGTAAETPAEMPERAGRRETQMKSVFAQSAESTQTAAWICSFFKTFGKGGTGLSSPAPPVVSPFRHWRQKGCWKRTVIRRNAGSIPSRFSD